MKPDNVSLNMWWEIFGYEIQNLFVVEILNKRLSNKLTQHSGPDCIRRFLKEKFWRNDSK